MADDAMPPLAAAAVAADWELQREGLEHLRIAVDALLRPGLAGLRECADRIDAAYEIDPRGVRRPTAKRDRLSAQAVAQAFGLSVYRRAALIELRWAAFAETRAELACHLDHAMYRLVEAMAEERMRQRTLATGAGGIVVVAVGQEAEG
jgi:hypothetical protein